jgi:hypothetical protein
MDMLIAISNHKGEFVLRIQHIFLSLLAVIGIAMLSGCNDAAPKEVVLPKEVVSVTAPFLAAVKRGDAAAAEKYVARYSTDETRDKFAGAHKILAAHPNLPPVVYRPKAKALMGLNDDDITLLYATKHKGRWISAEIRLFRLKGEEFQIEYWNVKNEATLPPMLEVDHNTRNFIIIMYAAMAFLALLVLGVVVWLVRRKPQLLAPDKPLEQRQTAITRRQE